MTRTFKETVPLSVIDPTAEDGSLNVTFEWKPGTPESGRYSGPPENYDCGSPDEFTIRSAAYDVDFPHAVGLADHEHERVCEWLEENWERPDYEGERADYLYQQMKDERMERGA